jgi:hypothetical protein
MPTGRSHQFSLTLLVSKKSLADTFQGVKRPKLSARSIIPRSQRAFLFVASHDYCLFMLAALPDRAHASPCRETMQGDPVT